MDEQIYMTEKLNDKDIVSEVDQKLESNLIDG